MSIAECSFKLCGVQDCLSFTIKGCLENTVFMEPVISLDLNHQFLLQSMDYGGVEDWKVELESELFL